MAAFRSYSNLFSSFSPPKITTRFFSSLRKRAVPIVPLTTLLHSTDGPTCAYLPLSLLSSRFGFLLPGKLGPAARPKLSGKISSFYQPAKTDRNRLRQKRTTQSIFASLFARQNPRSYLPTSFPKNPTINHPQQIYICPPHSTLIIHFSNLLEIAISHGRSVHRLSRNSSCGANIGSTIAAGRHQ